MKLVKILTFAVLLIINSIQAQANYGSDWTLSQTTTFQQQIQMSTFHAALAIVNEAATSRPTVDLKRHTLAVAVLGISVNGYGPVNGPFNMQFVWAAIETGLTGTPTDAQVDTAIATAWNGIAGVKSTD